MKFSGRVAHGPRKKLLDFGGNPDRIMLVLSLWLGEGLVLFHVTVTFCSTLDRSCLN